MSIVASWLASNEVYNIFIVTYGKSTSVEFAISDNVTIIQSKDKFNNKKRIIYAIKRAYFLRKTIQKLRPCVVISFGEIWNSFVLLSLLGLKRRVVISDRCTPNKEYRLRNRILRKILYPRAWGIISQTELAKEIYQSKFKGPRYFVIGNPIAPPTELLPVISERENIILSVGRLISTKNFDRLINIFAGLKRNDWKLIIVGGDAQGQSNYRNLQDLVTQYGMSENIELAGKQMDVSRYYQRAKIFAFTSSSEGFPNVIGEALSYGLPVVSYDCIAGPSEMIIEGYNGFLVKEFDDMAFKERLLGIMNDDALLRNLSGNAVTSVRRFSKENIGQSYLNLIQEVCEGSSN